MDPIKYEVQQQPQSQSQSQSQYQYQTQFYPQPQYGADRYVFAVTSFIVSLISIFMFVGMFAMSLNDMSDAAVGLIFVANLFFLVLGIIFGAMSLKSTRGKGLGISGFVVSLIVLALLFLLLLIGSML